MIPKSVKRFSEKIMLQSETSRCPSFAASLNAKVKIGLNAIVRFVCLPRCGAESCRSPDEAIAAT
jgi:hypothetical protein